MFNFRRDARSIDAGLMTPAELYRDGKLWRRTYGHRPLVMPWQVRPYRKEIVSSGLTLYTADRSARTLIIACVGRSDRPFIPMAAFLQALDHRRYDLVVASDARHLQFDRGLEGYAGSLPDFARRLQDFASARGYGGIITYGISLNGLAALRIGQSMGVDRAISVGGRFAWNVGRLLRNEAYAQSFDLLCHCRQPITTESYALFSEGHRDDAASAERLAAIVPACRMIPMPCAHHNFPHEIQKARRVDAYHRQIFDLSRKPDPLILRGLVKRRSRLDPRRSFYFAR